MNKLIELDNSKGVVIFDSEVLDVLRENSVDYLINYQFKNPMLMVKVWDSFMLDSGMAEIPQGKLYRYLTRIGYQDKPVGFVPYEVHKFWNLPNVILNRLLSLICPEVISLIDANHSDKASYIRISELLLPYKECISVKKLLDEYSEKLQEIFRKESRDEKDREYQKLVDQHKISFDNTPSNTIITSLLVLNGYHGSIFNGSKLEKLIWLATGFRLIDIIQDISKYIKIRDEIICTLNTEYQSVDTVNYDYDNFGLNNSKIYNHYLKECIRVGELSGRLERMYPGYSLSTLKSSNKAPISQASKKPKVSEYEVLKFIDENLNTEFEWVDVKDYLSWFDRFGVQVQLKDAGEGYCGINFDSEKLGEFNKILLKYDLTEFSNIRKVLVGIVDDQVEVTKLSESEIKTFDNDLACQMIEKLLEWDEITYNQLMEDMKWLRIVGHIGVSLRKVKKGSYKVQFNTVSFIKVVEIIYKSDLGYSVARKVLERLGQTKAFYRDVLVDFNPAIWNLHRCQMQLKYE